MSFLLQSGITQLPVNPVRIVESNGWKIYRYSQFAARIKKDVESLIANYDKDGFTFWSERDKTFIICYNESTPQNETRWTLTHEIAHIYLKHISSESPVMAKNGITNPLYEIEAEYFTLRVLCPLAVLLECRVSNPESVIELCGVPERRAVMAFRCLGDFSKGGGTSPLHSQIEQQFSDFIDCCKKNQYLSANFDKKSRPKNRTATNGGIFLCLVILRIRTNQGTKC